MTPAKTLRNRAKLAGGRASTAHTARAVAFYAAMSAIHAAEAARRLKLDRADDVARLDAITDSMTAIAAGRFGSSPASALAGAQRASAEVFSLAERLGALAHLRERSSVAAGCC